MRKRVLSVLQFIIFLGGGIFLVWWQLRAMTPEEAADFKNALYEANYWLVIPVIIISILSHISRAMRWQLLMEPLNYKPALKNMFAALMVGYLANAAVPRLGEVLKCTFLARYEKLPVDKLVGTIVIERIFDLICFILFIALTILIQIDLVGGHLKEMLLGMGSSSGFPLWAKVLIIIGIIAAVLLIMKLLLKKYPGNKIIYKINKFLKGIIEGIATIQHLKHRKMFIAHTLFIWIMYVMQIYIGFYVMDNTEHLGFKPACTVLVVATISMLILPNGIGIFPLFVMRALLIYGIAEVQGNAFGSLIWGLNTGIVIFLGFTSLLLLPIINKHKHAINTGNSG